MIIPSYEPGAWREDDSFEIKHRSAFSKVSYYYDLYPNGGIFVPSEPWTWLEFQLQGACGGTNKASPAGNVKRYCEILRFWVPNYSNRVHGKIKHFRFFLGQPGQESSTTSPQNSLAPVGSGKGGQGHLPGVKGGDSLTGTGGGGGGSSAVWIVWADDTETLIAVAAGSGGYGYEASGILGGVAGYGKYHGTRLADMQNTWFGDPAYPPNGILRYWPDVDAFNFSNSSTPDYNIGGRSGDDSNPGEGGKFVYNLFRELPDGYRRIWNPPDGIILGYTHYWNNFIVDGVSSLDMEGGNGLGGGGGGGAGHKGGGGGGRISFSRQTSTGSIIPTASTLVGGGAGGQCWLNHLYVEPPDPYLFMGKYTYLGQIPDAKGIVQGRTPVSTTFIAGRLTIIPPSRESTDA